MSLLARPGSTVRRGVSGAAAGGGGRWQYAQSDKFERQRTAQEDSLLASAYSRVPRLGFKAEALAEACEEAEYPPLTYRALFPRGESELVEYHLYAGRRFLRDAVVVDAEAKDEDEGRHDGSLGSAARPRTEWLAMSTGERIKQSLALRLRFNEPIAHHLDQAIGVMARPANIGHSLGALSLLVDDIWYLAGDDSSDFDWYTKRATLAMIYTSSELFMVQDKSPGYKDTYHFLDRRLDGLQSTIKTSKDIFDFVAFNLRGLANTVRSKVP